MSKAPKLLENVGKKAEREKQQHLFESAELMPMPPLELLDAPKQSGPRVIRRQNWSRCLGYWRSSWRTLASLQRLCRYIPVLSLPLVNLQRVLRSAESRTWPKIWRDRWPSSRFELG